MNQPARVFATIGILVFLFLNTTTPLVAALAATNNAKVKVNHDKHGRPILSSQCHAMVDATMNGIVIRDTKTIKGFGAFTTSTILEGAWIGEYAGELLTKREVETRYWNDESSDRDEDTSSNNADGNKKKKKKAKISDRRWIKSRKERNQGLTGDYLFDMGDDLFLDAEDSDWSSWCRFMNHAPEVILKGDKAGRENLECNVETKFTSQSVMTDDLSGHKTIMQPRLWFIARRDIENGEELLYDYGDSYWVEDGDYNV